MLVPDPTPTHQETCVDQLGTGEKKGFGFFKFGSEDLHVSLQKFQAAWGDRLHV